MSLLPVNVIVGSREQNIEEVAEVVQMDDLHLAVIPKRMDVIRDVQEGIFEAHPEFIMSIEQMDENDADSRFIYCEMPPVDKQRRDLLTEAVKNLYEECKARMDAVLLEEKRIFVELLAEDPESLQEVVDQINEKHSNAVSDSLMKHNLVGSCPDQKSMEHELKAIIQQYMARMTQDRLLP